MGPGVRRDDTVIVESHAHRDVRHCERSEAIQGGARTLDCFAALAMTLVVPVTLTLSDSAC
ncbi:hypothetical protein BRAS3809_1520014 [Bradyrhizobium sp. STM 3809]|nr:hypothetical protein BRAS3809_1520014 [Bradyrhizobium sp. STM 3809]